MAMDSKLGAYTTEGKKKKKLGIIEKMRQDGSPSITPFPGSGDDGDGESEPSRPAERKRRRKPAL